MKFIWWAKNHGRRVKWRESDRVFVVVVVVVDSLREQRGNKEANRKRGREKLQLGEDVVSVNFWTIIGVSAGVRSVGGSGRRISLPQQCIGRRWWAAEAATGRLFSKHSRAPRRPPGMDAEAGRWSAFLNIIGWNANVHMWRNKCLRWLLVCAHADSFKP